ncbi:MAG: hypothetical protein LUQ59_07345 [Methanothrix sp.]|nr:hypothetical protein [Methanothrix sp.]
MRERARVLDSRYLEFIEYLQKLGELQSITRMIARLCGQEDAALKRAARYGQEETEASRMLFLFWQRRWIEVKEIEKKGECGLMREYVITLSLNKIVNYLGEAEMDNSGKHGRSARPRSPAGPEYRHLGEKTPLAA